MPISKYPRYGHIIAPASLRGVLCVQTPSWARAKGVNMLSELTTSVWQVFSPEQCKHLARMVVTVVSKELGKCRKDLAISVPEHLMHVSISEIELEFRTHQCLVRDGLGERLGKLDGITVQELLSINQFGAKTLVDLLSSLESAGVDVGIAYGGDVAAVAIFRYPRRGSPIAPFLLQDALNSPLPSWAQRGGLELYSQLDSRCWDLFNAEECYRLADAVAGEIGNPAFTQEEIRGKRITVRRDLYDYRITELELGKRARNCLARSNIEYLSDLEGMSIGDLIDIRNFGTKSLLDLLTSLESIQTGEVSVQNDYGSSDDDRGAGRHRGLCADLSRQVKITLRVRSACELGLDDIRFPITKGLMLFGESTLGGLCNRIMGRQLDPIYPEKLAEEIRRLRTEAVGAKKLSLEDELEAIARCCVRQSDFVIEYFGWDGDGRRTLEEVGNKHGVTRERVRQITAGAAKRLQRSRTYTPVLDKAIREIGRMVPAMEKDVAIRLRELGICNKEFLIWGIVNAADILDKEVGFRIVSVYGEEFVIAEADDQLDEAIKLVKKASSASGACSIIDIEMTFEESKLSIDSDFLGNLLTVLPNFSWLDEDTGWFWFNTGARNPLANSIRKIMSVSDSIDVSELREGIGRHYRRAGFSPPRRVLLELCNQLGFPIEGNRVLTDGKLDWREELGDIERTMVSILKENDYVMARVDYEQLCIQEGINRSTFYVYLGNSPVIQKLAIGVYGLRGSEIDPGVVQDLAERRVPRRSGKALLDRGWTKDGKLWLAFNVTGGMIRSGTYTIPSAVREHLGNEFALYTDDGRWIASLKYSEQTGYGLGPALRRLAVEEGDCLVLAYNLGEYQATAYVGSHELLLEYQEL